MHAFAASQKVLFSFCDGQRLQSVARTHHDTKQKLLRRELLINEFPSLHSFLYDYLLSLIRTG